MSSDVLEEHVASIVRVREDAKQENSMKQVATYLNGVISQKVELFNIVTCRVVRLTKMTDSSSDD
jgi:hypothetical protein